MSKQQAKGKRDGSWEWDSKANNARLLEAITEFNANTQKVSLVHNGVLTGEKLKPPTVISCQFSTIPREGGSKKKQFKLGLGDCDWSHAGLELAKQRATKISLKLQHNEFEWEWFDEFIKGHKPVDEMAIALNTPIQVWIDKFYATKKGQLKERSLYSSYGQFFSRFYGKLERKLDETLADFNERKAKLAEEYKQKPLSEQLIRNCFEATESNTASRSRCYSALTSLLKIADLYDHFKKVLDEYKPSIEYKPKQRNVPSDKRIKEVYYNGFPPCVRGGKQNRENPPKWRWLYGLLATYGLRVHEAWNIANWDNPVILKGGQWVEAGDEELQWQEGSDRIIPAFNSSENTHHVLAIGHLTKTGYRLAYPLSPSGEDWVTEFNLKGKMMLPDVKNPLGHRGINSISSTHCTDITCQQFRNKQFGFTPHDLRHAFNHRGRVLGVSVTGLALSLGHSEGENSTTYAKHMGIETKKIALEASFIGAQSKNNCSHPSLELAKKQALELLSNSNNPSEIANQLLAFIYSTDNPLNL